MRNVALLAALAAAAVTALVAHAGGAAPSAAPTYNRDVAPILDAKCASCHRIGGIAPFPLTTAAEARAHASGIVRMTKAGLMPPWMPGPDSAAFVGRDVRRLSTGELATLAAWAAAGAPDGRAGDRHTKPARPAGLGGPGRTITLAPPKAYSPHAAGGGIDDYHCFLLDPKLRQSAYVTAALIRPQRTGSVHHVILYEAAGAQATAATQLNASHGGKGWSCFGGPDLPVDLNANGAVDRLGQPPWIAAWVPGHTSNALPAGTGVLLHKGAKIVMQVHYNLIAGTGPDRSRAQLRLRPVSTRLTALETHLVAAPVELPCPSGSSGPKCSRAQAFQDEIAKYGVQNAYIPTALLQLCGKTLADYPQDVGAGTRIPTSCDRAVHEPADDLRRRGAHAPARSGHLRRARPRDGAGADAAAHPCLGLPLAGRLLPEDTRSRSEPATRCGCAARTTTRRPAQPVVGSAQLAPRYVLWGEGTTDEMCLAMLSVAP